MPKSTSSESQDNAEFVQYSTNLDEHQGNNYSSSDDDTASSNYFSPGLQGGGNYGGCVSSSPFIDERNSDYDEKTTRNSDLLGSSYTDFQKTSDMRTMVGENSQVYKPSTRLQGSLPEQYSCRNMYQSNKSESPPQQSNLSRSESPSGHSLQSSDEEKLLIADFSAPKRKKKWSKTISSKKRKVEYSPNITKCQDSESDSGSSDGFIPVTEDPNSESIHNEQARKKRSYEEIQHTSFSDLEETKQETKGQKSFFSIDGNSLSPSEEESNRHNYSGDQQDFPRPAKMAKRDYGFKEDKYDLLIKHNAPIKRDNKGHSMMERMGYRPGEGLGKHSQGRVEPVELSKQRGRRGLGLTLPGLDPASVHWDASWEVVKVKEDVTWLSGCDLGPLDEDTLSGWSTEGPKDMNIENMTEFCDEGLLKSILNGKSVFDKLSADELFRARSRSNPFETLKNAIFLNRAALKMANMDAAFNFMFTSPLDLSGKPMLGPNELLYFADVCAGPGGFSEYVLWKNKWRAKGIGFTLKGDNDFNLSKFYAGSSVTFEPYYGKNDDGNIFDPENITSLTNFVMDVTNNKGVHFMMADGGFSVEGQENIQELLSKQLYLCQCLVALCIVREEGHFICKLFDLFSPFSAGIIYLMYRSFNQISIFKPNTSRPANSERYIICKHKRRDSTAIRDYMYKINERLCELGSSSKIDITHIVPMNELMNDRNFYDYLVDSNNSLGERQVVNLIKIKAFCQDLNLIEERQSKMQRECLLQWRVPNGPRYEDRMAPEEMADKFLKGNRNLLVPKLKKLQSCNLEAIFRSILDWQCFPLATKEHRFFLGLGGNRVFQWNPNRAGSGWEKVTQCDVKLTPGTLLFGEIIHEVQGEGKHQKKFKSLHVIDGVRLGNEDISCCPFHERLSRLQLYEKALGKKTNRSNFRVKVPVPMEELEEIFKRLTVRNSQFNHPQLLLEEKDYGYQPVAVLFVNTTKEHWSRNFSKTHNHIYFYDEITRKSLFEKDCPKDVNANVFDCLNRSLVWVWEEGVGLYHENAKDGIVHKDELIRYVEKRLRK